MPSKFSFHKETLLSPEETARIAPEVDQETLQTTSAKIYCSPNDFLVHCVVLASCVQMNTVLSYSDLKKL
jgi:hypothetical protein